MDTKAALAISAHTLKVAHFFGGVKLFQLSAIKTLLTQWLTHKMAHFFVGLSIYSLAY